MECGVDTLVIKCCGCLQSGKWEKSESGSGFPECGMFQDSPFVQYQGMVVVKAIAFHFKEGVYQHFRTAALECWRTCLHLLQLEASFS